MAQGDVKLYNSACVGVFNALNWAADTIKMALLKDTYVPDIDADTAWSGISAHECSGTGYTAGGVPLTGKTTSQDNDNDEGVATASTIAFGNIDVGAVKWGVLYKATGELLAYYDLTTATNGAPFNLTVNADGLFRTAQLIEEA